MDIILENEEILDISASLERDFLKGDKGDRGLKGEKGDKGNTGDTGPSNVLNIGTVEKGEEASATITGESPKQILNLVLPKGDKGDKGDIGETGPQGERGFSNVLTIGTVEKGDNAEANITGESPNQVLNLVLPKGDKGDKGDTGEIGPSNTLTIGTVEKGEEASASIGGDSPNQVLNLILPKGDKGDTGEKGDKGDKGDTYTLKETDYDDIAAVVETNIKPTLNQNLKEAKDYTDNAIVKDFKDISYNQETCTFIFTRHDNTTFTVDLPIENTVKNGHYDAETKELVLVLVSDQEIRIPASGLIDDYAGVDTATIQLTISADNKISANIKAGSITKTLLTTELQTELNDKVGTEVFNQELNKKLNIADVETKELLITYEDTTTETVKLVVYK